MKNAITKQIAMIKGKTPLLISSMVKPEMADAT